MPTAQNGNVSLYYETEGDGEAVVFLGDVGFGAWQWAWQHGAIAGPFCALVTDVRGVGRSDNTPSYTLVDLVADVEAILADAGLSAVHLVGAGLGGLVALDLAHRSGRVQSITLVGSGLGDATPMEAFAATEDEVRRTLDALVSPGFVEGQSEVVDQLVAWRAAEDAPREVWEIQTAVVEAFEAPPLFEVTTPALVLHGTDDALWPVSGARRLADDLPRGEFVPLDGAGHLAHVEQSRVVNDHLVGWLESQTA